MVVIEGALLCRRRGSAGNFRPGGLLPGLHVIQSVCPPLHHTDTLVPKFRASVSSTDSVVFHMSKLGFDSIRVPEATLIEDRGSGCAKAVSRHLVLVVTETPQGSV